METVRYGVLISVVMPVYNKERHLLRSINSVLNQSYPLFELIIVCDPSTDKSTHIVERFEDKRISIYYRDEAGPGGYAARNLGVEKSNSEWVAFIDADDEWLPEHLNNFVVALENNPSHKFFAALFDVYDGINLRSSIQCEHEMFRVVSFLSYLYASPFYTSTVIMNKNLFHGVGGFPAGRVKRGGDVCLWLRAIEETSEYILINKSGAIYYRDSDSMVTKTTPYTDEEVANEHLLSFINHYQDKEVSSALKVRFNNQVIYCWNQNMRMGNSDLFDIKGRLFKDVAPIKVCFYYLFSSVPVCISMPLHRIMAKLVDWKRNNYG
ncbi:glycosyltransferase family A protein [Oceanimonas baumannii]|uniref:Glycosyltransferase involved in cell wall biosynthesis n=1 Tax=Oceanimonas baumannii TaxID=129578 RepID=A0A235CQ43_9GAMM|nr:glycosyltransferase family A protein [Oceanimonas baumannii]OYD25975.1 hypothetical protein B6S09_03810 [Oceanimonas baumannii]TDW60004.1 glycosyltransferase involved in cell wall biosynthesis [Oceanimonas baumannii]